LFKELLQTFFEDFMGLFFPKVHEWIDFSHISFLSEEVLTDIAAGEKRRVDLAIETKLKEEDALIIVHIENQAYVQQMFNERMFIYFSRLYEKYRRKILPIAVFSYDAIREEPCTFHVEFPFMEVMRFQYYTVELKKKNWRDFLLRDSPVAAALLSRMGYNDSERVQVRKEFLRMLFRLKPDPARTRLLTAFFETYLTLNEQEEQRLQEEINQLYPDEGAGIMDLLTSWEKKGMVKGKIEGKTEAMHELLCKYISACFPEEARELEQQVLQISDLQTLEWIAHRVFTIKNTVEVRKLISDAVTLMAKELAD
jgi:hypothetical protein